ncbi:MAG: RsiV family protein, partial [Candidatus Atribacteria bacterium]|nr:RsiV family protein [Candidatus Atribacteria bacterium]
EIILSDILKDKKDYIDIINQEIKRQVNLNPQEYFSEWSAFQSISQEQPFYLIEDGMVIYFGLYEIAPYASGIRYFKIPNSLFGDS